jgi:mRNA interferase MazF
MPIERGDVYWVRFDPSVGGEIQKTRPAVVLSNNAANMHLNRVQVVPITSKVDRMYPGEAIVTLKGEKRKAIAAQLTTASKLRLGNKIGSLSNDDLEKIVAAVLVQLGIDRS